MENSKEPLSEQELYDLAFKRVRAKRDFYSHLFIYIIINVVLAILNYVTGGFPWVLFVILGWGVGVLSHGIQLYLMLNNDKDAVNKEMEKLRGKGL